MIDKLNLLPRYNGILMVMAICILLLIIDFVIHLWLSEELVTKKLEPQEVFDLARELNLEVFEHKATVNGAVLLKMKNEFMKVKYVTDDEKNVKLYFNGEAGHFESDARKKKIISSYRNKDKNFLIIQCGSDYEIISRIGDTMFVFEGKYKDRRRILLNARKLKCVPKKNIKNN